VYESGSSKGHLANYDTSDVLQVRINSAGKAEYVKNGWVIYTSATTTSSSSFPMMADASFYTQGGNIKNLKYITTTGFDSAPTATNGGTVNLQTIPSTMSQSGTTVLKASGGSSWDNAGALGKESIPSKGYGIEFKASQTNAYLMVGLNSGNANTLSGGHSYKEIDFALYPHVDGKLYVYESGSSRGHKGSYTTNDMLQVRINSSGKVEYVKAGTVIYTSSVSPTYPLMVDMSFYTQSAIIRNLKYITTSGFD